MAKTKASAGHMKIEAMEPPSSINFMGVKEMKVRISSVVHDVAEEDKWVIVTWHGKPRAMLIPFSEEDLEDFILANHPELIKRRYGARKEIERGDYLTHKQVEKLLDE